jgi:hypothetical protein
MPVRDARRRAAALVGHRAAGLIVRATDRGNARSLAIVTARSTVATTVLTAASDRAERRKRPRRPTLDAAAQVSPILGQQTDLGRDAYAAVGPTRHGMGPTAHHPRYVV